MRSFPSYSTTFAAFFLGQLLSLCLTSQNVFSTILANENRSIPTTQSFMTYVLLGVVYTGSYIYQEGLTSWLKVLKKRGIRYFLLALVDVEANYLMVKAFSMTSMLSVMLLDTWTIPVVVTLSIWFLRVRYKVVHYVGVLVCVSGMIFLALSDASLSTVAPKILLGDVVCLLAATLYGISNVMEQSFAESFSLSELLGQLGFFGSLISGAQLFLLERDELFSQQTRWNGTQAGVVLGFNLCAFLFYSLAPVLFRLVGATYFNLSLLTSDIYGLLMGMFFFHTKITIWYPLAFVWIMFGIVLFNMAQPKHFSDDSSQKLPFSSIDLDPPLPPPSQANWNSSEQERVK